MGQNNKGINTGDSSKTKISDRAIENKHFYWIYGIVLVLIFSITYIILQTPEEPVKMLRRFSGTFGFLTIFLAIVSSEYIARMKKITGLPFLKAHHNLARIGIILIILHPLTFVLQGRGFSVFSPISGSNALISLAGRPALYMFLLAAGIALYRKKYRNWRKIHYLNYLAFLLVTVHASMIGSDFRLTIMRLLAIAMAIIVLSIFIQKRSTKKIKRK